jgi:hypothetical protein
LRLDPGAIGLSIAVATGFWAHAAQTVVANLMVKESSASTTK